MDRDLIWNRITQAVRVLAEKHNVPVPAVLERVSGTPIERDQQRLTALNEFCAAAHIAFNPDEHALENLDLIAEWFDGKALEIMEGTQESSRRQKKRDTPVDEVIV